MVLVGHNMGRELPRTLLTLDQPRQRSMPRDSYEIFVLDNGSRASDRIAVSAAVDALEVEAKLIALDDAPPSPAKAANEGIAQANGSAVCLMIDGARMASPGLLSASLQALASAPRTIVATISMHLGTRPQMVAATEDGYNQEIEDGLLQTVDWQSNPYRLFEISVLAGSSLRGWFGPMGETNALTMSAALWDEAGGLDEAFDRPGGGLVNHDLFRRACELPDTNLVVLLGEATFHQFHNGAATGGTASRDELWAEYRQIRGREFAPPTRSRNYFGAISPQQIPHLEQSITWLKNHQLSHDQ